MEAKLEEVAGMTREDARNTLLEIVRNEARNDMARIIREVEAEAQEMAEQRARKLVIETMQRVATDVVAERAITTIELPNEEVKGRIIGRNGRNVQPLNKLPAWTSSWMTRRRPSPFPASTQSAARSPGAR